MTQRWSGVARLERGDAVAEHVSGERTPGSPMTAGTRIQGGSVAKTVLAIAALRLAELGALDLAAPISEVAGGLPPAVRPLTLHRLLSHTSGLGHWPDLPGVDMTDPPEGDALLELVLDRPLPHPVGGFRYSNFGYLLAGRVIAAATGRPYAAAARELVLEPAGMADSTSGVFPLGGDLGGEADAAPAAVGHRDGAALTTSPTPTSIPGTGDLWTTAADLIRLSRALHDGRLLERRSVEAMLTPHAVFDPAEIADPRIVADAYGYGVWLGTLRGERAAIHPGDNDGFRSMLVHAPAADARADDLHLAVLTNDDGPTLRAPLDLLLAGRGDA
jgi:CubicO group peptidase (beta-lactamase class C family)